MAVVMWLGWTASRRVISESDFLFCFFFVLEGLGTEWQEEIRHWVVVENDTDPNCARPRSRKKVISKRKGIILKIKETCGIFSMRLTLTLGIHYSLFCFVLHGLFRCVYTH